MANVQNPQDLAAEIDDVSRDRSSFVAEVARVDAVADELNDEAADVLEYQIIR